MIKGIAASAFIVLLICASFAMASNPLPPPIDFPATLEKADNGDVHAQLDLGTFYGNEARNARAYASDFRRRAENALGQSLPAPNHSYAELDFSDSLKKAVNGDIQAQIDVAVLYDKKAETAEASAAQWWQRAARQGHPYGQTQLSSCYSSGTGVTQNYAEAYFWRLVIRPYDEKLPSAGREGMDKLHLQMANKAKPNALLFLEKRLTPDEIAAMKSRAAAWSPSPEKAP